MIIFFESSILRPTSKNMIDLAFDKLKNSDFEDLAYFEPKYLKEFRNKLILPINCDNI